MNTRPSDPTPIHSFARGQGPSERQGTIAILGAGRAGRCIARALSAALSDRRIQLWARRPESLEGVEPAVEPILDFQEAARADLLILAVSDPAVRTVAEQLVPHVIAGRVVLHMAGGFGPEALDALEKKGCEVGAMHPLVALGPETSVDSFRGALFSISGQGPARHAAGGLADALGGVPLEVDSNERVRYHASASLIAQGAVALVQLAREDLAQTGMNRETARRGIATLLQSVATNLYRGEPRDVLTGPIARKDKATIAKHRSVSGPDSAAFQDLILRVLSPLVRG